jgi:hypothetical protein
MKSLKMNFNCKKQEKTMGKGRFKPSESGNINGTQIACVQIGLLLYLLNSYIAFTLLLLTINKTPAIAINPK